MKKGCLFLTLLALASFSGFADEAKKHYCSPEQVELSDALILVHLENKNPVEIDALHVDQGGVYFHEDAMRCLYCRRTINPKNTCECPVIH